MNTCRTFVRHLQLVCLFVVVSFSAHAQTYDIAKEVSRWQINDSLSAICPDSLIRLELPIEVSGNQRMTGAPLAATANEDTHSHIPTSITIDTSKDVGEIPFSSGVSSTGAVTYAIPIDVVSGRNGFQPDVSVVYNSQGGNDVLGYGWTIGGLSSITRISKSIYYDGQTAPIALNSSDAFMLDGVRLLPVTGQTYAYEPEQGNMRVKANVFGNTINFFTVEYPNGSVGTYSNTNNLSFPLTRLQDALGNYIIFTYEMVENRNYVKQISYGAHVASSNTHYASVQFSYRTREDVFSGYESGIELKMSRLLDGIDCYNQSELLHSYRFSYQADKVSLLSKVILDNLNPLAFYYGYSNNSNTLVKQETIIGTYFEPGVPIVVSKAKFSYGTDDDGLIIYPDKNPCMLYYENWRPGTHSKSYYYSEFNPEQDLLVHLYQDNSSILSVRLKAEAGFQALLCADIDGVPGEEIIKINNTQVDGQDVLTIKTYIPSTLYQKSLFEYKSEAVPHNDSRSFWPKIYLPGDYNGDGKMELLAVSMMHPLGKEEFNSKCCLIDLSASQILFNDHVFDYDVQNSQIIPMDVDGDGKTDVCHVHDKGIDVYSINKVNGTYRWTKIFTYTGINFLWLQQRTLMLGDINGDGKPDMVLSPRKSYKDYCNVMVETRTSKQCSRCGEQYPNAEFCPECGEELGYSDKCAICDRPLNLRFECDNHSSHYLVQKMASFHNGTLWDIYYSTGTGFVKSQQDFMECNRDYSYILQDVNADGVPDLVEQGYVISIFLNQHGKFMPRKAFLNGKYPNLIASSISRPNYHNFLLSVDGKKIYRINYTGNEAKQRLLTGAVSSLGVVSKNFYRRINESGARNGFYTKLKDPSVFPFEDYMGPLWAASQQETVENGTPISSVSYEYGGAVAHRQGLGFRGFTYVSSYDLLRNRDGVKQTFDPYNFGALVSETTPVSETNYTNYINIASNKKVVARPTAILTKDLLKRIKVNRTLGYDAYNNPVSEIVQYSDDLTSNIIRTEINRTFKNSVATGNYLIGLPLTQTITEYRDGNTWMQSEEITYKGITSLPESKIAKINGNKAAETRWTYDTYGNVLTAKSAAFANTNFLGKTFTYDSNGRYLVTETNELGHITTYSSYTKFGLPALVTDFKQKNTTYAYDGLGRISSVHNPDGTLESTTYAWGSDVGVYYALQSSTGKPQQKTYCDALNREVRKSSLRFDGVWMHVDTQYDDYGRVSKVSHPFKKMSPRWITYTYDEYDRPTNVSEPSGKVTTTDYSGNSVTVVQNGISSTRTYDKSGLLASVLDPAGTITYEYRPDKQPSKIIAPGNIETLFEYDSYGRRTKIVDPSAGTKTFAYDASGNMAEEVDANGNVIRMSYDAYDRLTKREYVNELITDYTYNSDGLLVSEQSNNGTGKTYLYDDLLRLQIETEFSGVDNLNLSKTYTYDNGNLTAIGYSNELRNGVSVGIGWESYIYTNGTLSEITWKGKTSIWQLINENDRGELGVCYTGELFRRYIFDVNGKPTLRYVEHGNNMLQKINYRFSSQNDNLLLRMELSHGESEQFEYDHLNRLITFGGKGVTYDEKGNIVQLSGVGSLEYDPYKPYSVSSVLPAMNCRIPSVGQTITYNAMMRPKTISQNGYDASFVYNANGERVRMYLKKPSKPRIVGGYSTNYYYFGAKYEVIDNPGESLHKEIFYIGGDAYDAPAVYVKDGNGSWTLYYICRDNLGSITHVVDESGVVKQELSYDAWGNLRDPKTHAVYASGSEPELFLGRGYTGHEHLTMFGLINMNARLYDPTLGRFLSPDPYVQMPDFTQNFNRYSYCLNNPFAYVDESGESIILAAAIIGAWIGMGTAMITTDKTGWGAVGDMMKGLFIGGVSGAVGAWAGGAMAGLLGTSSFIGGAASGVAGGFTSGFIGGAGNTWLGGGGFVQGLRAGGIGGGIGGAIGGLVGGISGGISSIRHKGNFFTGKGATFTNEMVSDGGDLGGDFFTNDTELHEYVNSQNGWSEGQFGIDNISVESNLDMTTADSYYYRESGTRVILKTGSNGSGSVSELNGLTVRVNRGLGKGFSSFIHMSPRATIQAFTETLNHEFIHAFHNSLGLSNILGNAYKSATEQSAYLYSLTHSTGVQSLQNALRGLQLYRSPITLSWPGYLIKF